MDYSFELLEIPRSINVFADIDIRKTVISNLFLLYTSFPNSIINIIVKDIVVPAEEYEFVIERTNTIIKWLTAQKKELSLIENFSYMLKVPNMAKWYSLCWNTERCLAVFSYELSKDMRENLLLTRDNREKRLKFMLQWQQTINTSIDKLKPLAVGMDEFEWLAEEEKW